MAKVCVISGNRSDGGLLEPLVDRLKCPHIKMWGNEPDLEVLPNSDTPVGTCMSQALVLLRLPPLIEPYDSVVILGDRFEALAASLVAYNMGKVIYHVQSSDWTPKSLDNGYRAAIRVLSTWHFPIEDFGSLGCVFPDIPPISPKVDFVLCFHPYKGPYLEELVAILRTVKHSSNGWYFTANTDAGGRQINQILEAFGPLTMERKHYLKILKKAKFIIGNSSSGLIEAPCFRVKTINVGYRQEGRLKGPSVIDCEGTEEAIKAAIAQPVTDFTTPYYREGTVEMIAEVIERHGTA